MNDMESVEEKIRHVLELETDAISLSNTLFSPDGLFNELAGTEAERRAVAATSLFQQAQRRLLELQSTEAAEFAKSVQPRRAR